MEACKICCNQENNQTHSVKEMMFDYNESFQYLECGQCGCLQLINVPESIERYYPDDYWNFEKIRMKYKSNNIIKKWFRRRQTKYWLTNKKDFFGKLISLKCQQQKHISWVKRAGIENLDAKILDVGCGLGDRLLTLQQDGFTNLSGVDPFIEKDIDYKNGVKIFKKSLFEIEGQFDLITLHHSFEHMPEPLRVLQKLSELIKPGCHILIRIPVASSYAWKYYGVNWFQIDAPRHLFLHTENSLNRLIKNAGLNLNDKVYDSNAEQFWASEQYVQGIALMDERSYEVNQINSIFSTEDIMNFRKKAIELNNKEQGDQACFYIKK